MAILAVIDVDDRGSLVVRNFKDSLQDLDAQVRRTSTGIGQTQAPARQAKDALSQLVTESREAAQVTAKNAQGFGILSTQLKEGVSVTKLHADALAQLATTTGSNIKFTAQYGIALQELTTALRTGAVVSAEKASQLRGVAAGYKALTTEGFQNVSMLEKYRVAALAVATILTVLSASTYGLLRQSGDLAGRIETLDVVIRTMGQNSKNSSLDLLTQAEATRKLGITTRESKEAVIQFSQAQLNVADTSRIARAAQDLAVVAGENSSATFNRLTTAIQVQQPMLLRQVGIVSGLTQIYTEHAKTLNKTWRELDTLERRQAFVNKILAEADKVAGAYEASMTTAAKQIGSFARFVEESKVALGEALLPTMMVVVQAATALLKAWIALPPEFQALATAALVASTAVSTFAAALVGAKFLGIIDAITSLRTAWKAMTLDIAAGTGVVNAATTAFGRLQLALGVFVIALSLAAAAWVYLSSRAKAGADDIEAGSVKINSQIVLIEQQQKKLNEASKAITEHTAEQAKLVQQSSLSREETERLTLITQKLTDNKRRQFTATQELLKLAPGVSAAIQGETIDLQKLNTILDQNIAKRRQQLAILAADAAGKLTDAQKTFDAARKEQDAIEETVKALEAQIKLQEDARKRAALPQGSQGSAIEAIRGLDALKAQLKDVNARFAEQVGVVTQADTEVRRLTEQYNALDRAANPEKLKAFNAELNAKAIATAREQYQQLGTTIEQAFGVAGKKMSELYARDISPEKVAGILSEVEQAWTDHTEKLEKEKERLKGVFKSTYESITGDSATLATQLRAVEQALGGVGEETDAYIGRLLRAKDLIEKSTTLTAAQKKEFKEVVDAALKLKQAELVETLTQWRDKAKEVTDSFRIMKDEAISALATDLEKMSRDADIGQVDERKRLNEQLLGIERELYERTVVAKRTETEQKIFENNRYYRDLTKNLDDQIEQMHRLNREELQAIQERASLAEAELHETKRRAMERFQIEISTEQAIDKAKRAIADARGRSIEQLTTDILDVRRELAANLDTIVASGSAAIRELERIHTGFADNRRREREQDIDGILDTQERIVAANRETNAQILRESSLMRQAVFSVGATALETFTQALGGALMKTQSWKEAMVDVFRSLQRALMGVLDSIVQQWIKGLGQMIFSGQGAGGAGFWGGMLSLLKGKGAPVAGAGVDMAGVFSGPLGAVSGSAGLGWGGMGTGFSGGGFATAGLLNAGVGLGAGIAIERLMAKFFGPGALSTGLGAAGGAGVGFAFGGPVGAAVGGLTGLISGIVNARKNVTKGQRQEFLEELGFSSADELRDFLVGEGRAKEAQDLFNRAANVIGKRDLEGNKKWMEEVVKLLGQIETSKAWDTLVDSFGSVDNLKKAFQLVGQEYAFLDNAMREGNVEEFKRLTEELNKALEAQEKRLKALGVAAGGLQLMAGGFAQTIEKELSKIRKSLSTGESDLLRGEFERRKEGGFEGSELQVLTDLARKRPGDFSPETLKQIADATQKAQLEFSRMGSVATAVFAGILADTGDIVQAMAAIAPSLDVMIQAQKDLGLEAEGAFATLLQFRQVIVENEDVANSLSGITQVLRGLGEAGIRSQGIFTDMGASAAAAFQTLTERGVSTEQILMLMQPTLQALYEAQRNFGYATDEATQRLIDMGKEHGVVGDHMQSINRQILDVLIAIGDALGATLPEAYRNAARAAQEATPDLTDPWVDVEQGIHDAEEAQINLIRRTRETRDAFRDMGDAARDALENTESAATHAAEGSSPTGMRQLVARVMEAQQAFRALRELATSDLYHIERSAGLTFEGVDFAGVQQALAQRVSATDALARGETMEGRRGWDAEPQPAQPVQVVVNYSPVNDVKLSSLDGADAEGVMRTKIVPQLITNARGNLDQLAAELEAALQKYRR